MKSFLMIFAILLTFASIAAYAHADSLTSHDTTAGGKPGLFVKSGHTPARLSPGTGAQARPVFPIAPAKHGGAADKNLNKPENGSKDELDLRYVDWDTLKNGKNPKGVKNGNGGDKGEEEDEEKEKENAEDKKDDGGGGGWNRLWDSPKLG